MLKPTIPENEMMRLQALKQYNVLDTLPEDAFDNIAKIASLLTHLKDGKKAKNEEL